MDYKISVIMPVYNAAKFLKEAMDSLIGQTIGFENLQVIIVDDCSTDESPELIREYAERYSNVEMYKTEVNSGAAGKPRNIGFKHVKAPYIMFLDSDDFYDKDACRILYQRIVDTKAEIVSGYFNAVNEQGKYLRHFCPSEKEKTLNCPEQIVEALKTIGGFWNRIYDAGFINENHVGFTSEGYGEDTTFTCKCVSCSCQCIYIPFPILNYRQNEKSVTHVLTDDYFVKCIPSTMEIKEILAPYPNALQYKLEELGAGYFEKSVSARSLDAEALAHVYTKHSDLFVKPQGYMTPEYTLALKLISSGNVELAVEYALAVREFEARYDRYESIIRQHEDRLISRLANAINQHHFGEAIRICLSAARKKLRKE